MRIETNLNRYIWSQGIRNVPRRVRVRVQRRRNEDEDAKEKFYCIVTHVTIDDKEGWKGLLTENSQAADADE